eukprot:4161072-Karenia_brevis.AAC.1
MAHLPSSPPPLRKNLLQTRFGGAMVKNRPQGIFRLELLEVALVLVGSCFIQVGITGILLCKV